VDQEAEMAKHRQTAEEIGPAGFTVSTGIPVYTCSFSQLTTGKIRLNLFALCYFSS
jgi:hypothetical protein